MNNTNKTPWTMVINFEAHPDWEPLADWCWVHCPLAIMTKLGEVCKCKKIYIDTNGKDNFCPVSRYAKKVRNDLSANDTSQ